MADAREALRRRLASAAHVRRMTRFNRADAVRHASCEPLPVDWEIADAVLELGEVRERYAYDSGAIVIPTDEEEALRDGQRREFVKRYAELSIPLPLPEVGRG